MSAAAGRADPDLFASFRTDAGSGRFSDADSFPARRLAAGYLKGSFSASTVRSCLSALSSLLIKAFFDNLS
jgi:hypothetical protein